MAEYYAVERTNTYLAHYGIKGMRWGVRKALDKKSDKKLAKAYLKAAAKLNNLNNKADISWNRRKQVDYDGLAKKAGKIGSIGTGVAIAGTGTNHTMRLVNGLYKKLAKADFADLDRKSSEALQNAENEFSYYYKRRDQYDSKKYNQIIDDLKNRHAAAQNAISDHFDAIKGAYDDGMHKRRLAAEIGKYAGIAGAVVGAAGLGTAAVAKGKSYAAKKRMTEKGHSKAVSKRDAWRKEMQSAFKGTHYSNLPTYGQAYYEAHKERLDRQAAKRNRRRRPRHG